MHYAQTSNAGAAAGSGQYATFLPLGLTPDTSKLPITGAINGFFPLGEFELGSNTSHFIGKAYINANGLIIFVYQTDSSGTNFISSTTGAITVANGASYRLSFSIPCAQFSNTMTIVGLDEPMFLSNSNNGDNDSTSATTISDIGGSPLPVALSAARMKNILLPRALMPNETPVLEVRSKMTGAWVSVAFAEVPSLFVHLNRNAIGYDSTSWFTSGMSLAMVTATELQVVFQYVCRGTPSYPTAGGVNNAARTWANITAAADGFDRWRVRIAKSGEVSAVPPTPHFKATGSGNEGPVPSWSVVENTGPFSVSGGSVTVTLAGVYILTAQGNANNIGRTYLYVKLNGVNVAEVYIPDAAGSSSLKTVATTTIRVPAGGVITVDGGDTSGLAITLSVTRVGS
jgi:hypothetical protein